MSKTIREIADELGVSKTTIRKYWKRLPQTLSETVCGKVCISDEGEARIKSMFSDKTANQIGNGFAETLAVTGLRSEVEYLREENRRLLDLLDHEQQLHLSTKRELQLLLEAPKPRRFLGLFGRKNS